MAFFMSRRNIVKNEFVGQLVRIEFPQADRVVDILQVLKLLPLHDAGRCGRRGRVQFVSPTSYIPPKLRISAMVIFPSYRAFPVMAP